MPIHLWGAPYTYPNLDLSLIPNPKDYENRAEGEKKYLEAVKSFRARVMFGPDYRWWLSLCVKIPSQHGVIPLRGDHGLWPWMQDVSWNGIPDRTIMLKSREIGSTTLWTAMFLRDHIAGTGNTLIAADKEDNAVKALNYLKTMIAHLPDWCRPEVEKENESLIKLAGQAGEIQALVATPKSGRAARCVRLLATEMAFWQNDATYWAAVTGSGVEGMKIVVESTAGDPDTVYNDLYLDPSNGYTKHFYGWRENPTHSDEWYKQRRKDITERHLFIREYPSTPQEAFTGSSDTLWSNELFEELNKEIEDPKAVIPLHDQHGTPNGWVHLWARPTNGEFYVAGVDAAEGKVNKRNKPDWSEISILNWRTGKQVCTISTRLSDDEFAAVAVDWCRKYNNAHVVAERGSAGLAVIRQMQMLGYRNFYYQTVDVRKVRDHRERERNIGFTTNKDTKPFLVANFSSAVKSLDLTIKDEATLAQMKSFQRATLSATDNSHDDKIIASALAQEGRRTWRPSARMREENDRREGGLDEDYDPYDNPRRDRRAGYFELDPRKRGPAWAASKLWG